MPVVTLTSTQPRYVTHVGEKIWDPHLVGQKFVEGDQQATLDLPALWGRCRTPVISRWIHPAARLREQVEVQGSPLDAYSKTAHLWNSLSVDAFATGLI